MKIPRNVRNSRARGSKSLTTAWKSTYRGSRMGAPEKMDQGTPFTREQFEAQLRAKGRKYHIYHPYQVAMNTGKLTKEQIQGWVCNRFYYQISIPVKDAAILANMPDRHHRRQWIQRIIDPDGTQGDEGGIEAGLTLGE